MKNSTAIHNLFKQKDGSDAISGVATLDALIEICKERNPKTILELGGGIGTITYALLANSDATVDVYEHNEFCRKQLHENFKMYRERMRVVPSYDILPPRSKYDLIIVDGGKGKGHNDERDGGYPRIIGAYLQSLDAINILFIEGQRKSQKFWILQTIRTQYTYRVKRYADPSGGKKIGVLIECTPCRSEFVRTLTHAFQRGKVYK